MVSPIRERIGVNFQLVVDRRETNEQLTSVRTFIISFVSFENH